MGHERVEMESKDEGTVSELASPESSLPAMGIASTVKAMFSRTGIGIRLLLWITLFSSVAALVSTSVELFLEYRRQVSIIEERLDKIGDSTRSSLTASMWNLDTEQIQRQLEGLMLLPNIRSAEVRIEGLEEPIRVERDNRPQSSTEARTFTISVPTAERSQTLGTLRVEASLSGIYSSLYRQALEFLAAQAVETFLVSFSVFLLFHLLVTRHLIAFAAYLRHYNPLLAPPDLMLRRKRLPQPDELALVVQSFNETSHELYTVNRELAGANAALERDIAQRQVFEDQLYRKAHYDELTGLANRVLIADRIQQATASAQRTKAYCALLMIDLDDFKNVNDTRGHAAGDQLLREAARRLRQCHRPEDSLARMGGDEFLILLPSIQKTHASQRVVDRVIEAFSRAFEIDGQSYHVTASIGVALYPNDGLNATELLANAESAMYRAKDLGRNRTQFFTAEIHDRVQRRLKLEQLLRGATERGEFVLHYQPIYTGNSPHPAAFEALLRWRQADGSLVSPAEFIPVAEETGIIEEIGTWVMATACLDGVRLCSIYPGCPRVCVNVSPRQLREVGFARRTVLALAATGLPATQLEIEITEGIVVDERPEVAANLEELSRLGVRISIDDFGTGYSSLGYLQRYSFSTLKVDRSFVWEIGKNPAAGRLIEAILNMARGLNLETIAEGVETEAQLEFLLEHGCNLFQGFLLGRPISIEQHLHEVTASVAELS